MMFTRNHASTTTRSNIMALTAAAAARLADMEREMDRLTAKPTKAPLSKPESAVCERCGKELVNEESMALGVGPICAAGGRGGASRARAEKWARKAGFQIVQFEKVSSTEFVVYISHFPNDKVVVADNAVQGSSARWAWQAVINHAQSLIATDALMAAADAA